jgi:hypothetical protein
MIRAQKVHRMRSGGWRVALVLVGALTLCVAQVPLRALAAALPPVLPPALVALEQKMDELKITTMRFSVQSKVSSPKAPHNTLGFLKLLFGDTRISGELTVSPPAANVTTDLFGHAFTIRQVGSASYFYLPQLARLDHGRPWVALGPGGLSELVTVNGHPLKPTAQAPAPEAPSVPALAQPPFTGVQKLIAKAREVRELGPGIVDGQPVTRFLAVLEPVHSIALRKRALIRAPRPRPATITVELSLAADGVPVLVIARTQAAAIDSVTTLEVSAVNVALVIEAPPASQTISLAEERQLERRYQRRHRRRK